MKTNGKIVGIHDFVSAKNVPWRVIYAVVDMKQTDDDVGQKAVQIFQGMNDEYYGCDHDSLLGADCKVASGGGKDILAYVAGLDD